MSLDQFCRGELVSVTTTTTVEDIAREMKKFCVGSVVVTLAEGDRFTPVGIVTDRDLATRCLAEGRDPKIAVASDVMSHEVVVLRREASSISALKLMADQKVRRLVLIDDQGTACGLVSSDDLVRALAEQAEDVSLQLKLLATTISVQTGSYLRRRVHDFTRMA